MEPSDDLPGGPAGLEADLDRISETFRGNRELCLDLYNALCNIEWQRISDPLDTWACSWRYAGGLAADLCKQGEDYMDYYCSGKEQAVTPAIRSLLGQLGWVPTAESELLIGKPPGICITDFAEGTTKRIDSEDE